MKSAIIALTIASLSTGCSQAHFNRLAVPDVVAYSPEIQKTAANELIACDAPTLMEFLKDYGVMRDQARAALAQ